VSAALAPAFATVAALLVVAGATKVRNPLPARLALRAIAAPSGPVAVRVVGAAEIAIGALCLVRPDAIAAGLLTLAYVVFACFVWQLLRAGGSVPCGCFGASLFEPSRLHVAMDLVAAAVALIAIASAPPALFAISSAPASEALVLATIAAATYLGVLAFTFVPELWRSWTPQRRPG
jgi:hypothetical protein